MPRRRASATLEQSENRPPTACMSGHRSGSTRARGRSTGSLPDPTSGIPPPTPTPPGTESPRCVARPDGCPEPGTAPLEDDPGNDSVAINDEWERRDGQFGDQGSRRRGEVAVAGAGGAAWPLDGG